MRRPHVTLRDCRKGHLGNVELFVALLPIDLGIIDIHFESAHDRQGVLENGHAQPFVVRRHKLLCNVTKFVQASAQFVLHCRERSEGVSPFLGRKRSETAVYSLV